MQPSILRLTSSALPEVADSLPSEFRLFKFGDNPAWKIGGEELNLIFDEESAKAVMAAFAARGLDRIAIDLDHQTFNAEANGQPAKSYGWFIPAVKGDGLYATDVKWTPEGAELLKAKAYRFFSPTVQLDDEGRVVDLLPVALTNLPALKGIAPLVAAKATATEEKKMKLVLNALGVAEDADEKIALSAVEQLKDVQNQVLALSGKATIAEALGAITAMKQSAEKVETLTAEVAQLKAEKLQAEVTGMIDEAVTDGRVTPAKRTEVEQLAVKLGVDGLKVFLSMLPKQPAQSAPVVAPSKDPAGTVSLSALTDADKQVAKTLGISFEAYAASKARLAQ